MARRVCEKCMKSNAKIAVAQAQMSVEPNMRFRSVYSTGSISTPNRTPEKRQPNGFMPKSSMPMAMMSLPSGGCETSYGYTPSMFSYAVRAWYISSKYVLFK